MPTYRDWDALLSWPAAQSGSKICSKNIWIICKSPKEEQHRLHFTAQRIWRREIRSGEPKAVAGHQHLQNEHIALDHIYQKDWFIHFSVLKLFHKCRRSRSNRECRWSIWDADLITAELHDGTLTLHDWRRRSLLRPRVFQNQQDQEGLQQVHLESQILRSPGRNKPAYQRQNWWKDVGSNQ